MNMLAKAVLAATLLSTAGGCATYRVTSNIPAATASASTTADPVMLVQGEPHAPFRELGPIQITVRKGSPFVATPGRDEADRALTQKARDMGAEAVIRIQYQTGFDVMTWGHISASGIGIRFTE